MAVSGSGTSSDPYKVHSWDEFTSVNISSNAGQYITFANTYIDSEGHFTGAGTGTKADPYMCTTYKEVMAALGCSYIWDFKKVAVSDESEDYDNGDYLYYYNEKYARHCRETTTIDFNDLGITSSAAIKFYCNTNVNGWTLRNIKFNDNAGFQLYSGVYMQRAILLNIKFTAYGTGDGVVFFANDNTNSNYVYIYDVIGQFAVLGTGNVTVFNNKNFFQYRCALSISGSDMNIFSIRKNVSGSANATYIYDCHFHFDNIVCNRFADDLTVYSACLCDGKITNHMSGGGLGYIAHSFVNTIWDVDHIMDGSWSGNFKAYGSMNSGSVYTNRQGTRYASYDGFKLVTDEQIRDPAYLASIGVDIGVD